MLNAEKAMGIILRHWSIEQVHNTLDTRFHEDYCTTRTKDAPVVLSVLRKCAMNIVSLVALGWTENHPDNDDYSSNVRKVYTSLEDNIEKAIEDLYKAIECIQFEIELLNLRLASKNHNHSQL